MRTDENRSARSAPWRESAEEGIVRAGVLADGPNRWSPSKPAEKALSCARTLLNAIKSDALPLPITSAGPDGVFSIEWREPDRAMVFSILEDGLIEYYVRTPHIPDVEGEIGEHFDEKVNEIVETFLRR